MPVGTRGTNILGKVSTHSVHASLGKVVHSKDDATFMFNMSYVEDIEYIFGTCTLEMYGTFQKLLNPAREELPLYLPLGAAHSRSSVCRAAIELLTTPVASTARVFFISALQSLTFVYTARNRLLFQDRRCVAQIR